MRAINPLWEGALQETDPTYARTNPAGGRTSTLFSGSFLSVKRRCIPRTNSDAATSSTTSYGWHELVITATPGFRLYTFTFG